MSIAGVAVSGSYPALLRLAFETAVYSALPESYLLSIGVVERIRALPQHKRCHIVGAGKSAAAMAAALETIWPREALPPGVVVTRDGYRQSTWSVSVLLGGHPYPDVRSGLAADQLTAYLDRLDADDHVIALISGGGSSLLSKPVVGVSLQALSDLTRQLMAKGVPIAGLNTVRKHLTTALGGKLARTAYPATVDSIILSDVVGDDPSIIASGPFYPDETTLADARSIIRNAGIIVDQSIMAALNDSANETSKPGDPVFANGTVSVISANCWIDPVTRMLAEADFEVEVIDRHADGDARDLARCHAARALAESGKGKRLALVSGGEATVRLRGNGIGGPNAEYSLQLARELAGQKSIWAIACDTDGTDGLTEAAGAIITPDTCARASALGLQPDQSLATSDSGSFFYALGDAVVSGPTFTNVNDMRIILIDG